jgi:Sugar-transfer associated ATP-grasp
LSQNSNLQTVRITTFIGRAMKCHILFSHLKLMTLPEVFTDNIGDGRSANLTNVICLETGRIVRSLLKTPDGAGYQALFHHPITHGQLIGFPIPCWREACDLACRAAHTFLPVRSVGWDVAITDAGVKILEGNIWWDRRDYAGDYLATLLTDLDSA